MNTIYKGFTITSVDGRFVLENGKSYATLAAAKGAISKAQITDMQGSIVIKDQQANAIMILQSVNETDSAIRAVLKLAKARAILPSRNKREGKFAGVVRGKHYRDHVAYLDFYTGAEQGPSGQRANVVFMLK